MSIANMKTLINVTTFIFTITMVIYGLTKGFDFTELTINVLYFIVLIIQQSINLVGDN